MRLRPALLFLLLLVFSRTSFAADASDVFSLKVSHFGLEGNYATPGEATWVEVTAHNNFNHSRSFTLVVAEVSLDNNALPISETVTLAVELAASETRAIDVPLHIVSRMHAVLFVQAFGVEGQIWGRTGMVVGQKMTGQIIAMLCATPDVCRSIRQSILLSGGPEEQTRKSSLLRLIQPTKAAPAGWAYSPADILILAAAIAQFSEAQRDAASLCASSDVPKPALSAALHGWMTRIFANLFIRLLRGCSSPRWDALRRRLRCAASSVAEINSDRSGPTDCELDAIFYVLSGEGDEKACACFFSTCRAVQFCPTDGKESQSGAVGARGAERRDYSR